MSERPKPKSNAVLKNLPRERQEQIAEWCAKPNDVDEDGKVIPRSGGLAFAQAQLGADGLKVSLDTLSRFFTWWQLEQDLEISFEHEDQILAKTGDPKKAREAGENLLARLGLAKQSPILIEMAAKISDSRRSLDLQELSGKTKARQKDQQLGQREREIKLAIEKFQFDAAKAALAQLAELRAIQRDATLSESAKIERVQLRLFGAPPQAMEGKA